MATCCCGVTKQRPYDLFMVSDHRLTFTHTDDIYSLMESIVTVAVPEIHLSDNNGSSTTFPSLNRCSRLLPFIYISYVTRTSGAHKRLKIN